MFPLSKHKRLQQQHLENNAQDSIANNIAKKCIKVQEQWATFMQRKSERFSGQAKKFLLALCFLLSGGYSLYLIAESFFSHKIKPLSITPIEISEHAGKAHKNTIETVIVPKAEYEGIHRFQLYVDSLSKNASGKTLYDSILNMRPSLIDSIRVIENMYQLQSSKK